MAPLGYIPRLNVLVLDQYVAIMRVRWWRAGARNSQKWPTRNGADVVIDRVNSRASW